MLLFYKKQLDKYYKKHFKKLNKTFFKDQIPIISLNMAYLKYLRDLEIGKTLNNKDLNKINIATLNTAIAELESWQKTDDLVKKKFHLANFCELLKLNMEDWLTLNDSV